MKPCNHHSARPAAGRQRGAALVIGLIVLLMLTLLGVSNMNMTSVELKITSNVQNRHHAFQGAASLIEQSLQAQPASEFAVDFTDAVTAKALPAVEQNSVRSSGETQFTGNGSGIECPGGQGLRVSCNFFEIRSSATHLPSGAISNQVQGLYRPGILIE